MMRRFLLGLWALSLVTLSGGCGDSSQIGTTFNNPNPDQIVQAVLAQIGSTIVTNQGITLIIPPGSLSQDTTVVLDHLDGDDFEPEDPAFDATGVHLRVDFGAADLIGPVTFEFPHPPGVEPTEAIIHAQVDGVSIPLETAIQPDGDCVADLTVDPRGAANLRGVLGQGQITSIVVGILDEGEHQDRVPHVNWPSYNAYVFENGTFRRFNFQGTAEGVAPELGNRPLLFVHGLGGAIKDGEFNNMAAFMDEFGGFTSIIGFEYDSLAPIANNGLLLQEAITRFNAPPYRPGPGEWFQLGHSMGTLVTRTAFETNPGSLPITGQANVVLLCSPSLGSQAAVAEQGFGRLRNAIKFLILNKSANWTNADGTPCIVTGQEDGFTDLRPDSAYIQDLNIGVSHPQAEYRVIAALTRKSKTEIFDLLLGTFITDGLVSQASATAPAIGFVDQGELPFDDHFSALLDSDDSNTQSLIFLETP